MSPFENVVQILEGHGFGWHKLQKPEPSEALFVKVRAGASIYVTVPLNCDPIPDSVIETIMTSAQIPITKWRHLLSAEDSAPAEG